MSTRKMTTVSAALLSVSSLCFAQSMTIHRFTGDDVGDEFGAALNVAGDVDRDGFVDVLVGAPRDDDQGTSSGSVSLLSGKTGGLLFKWTGHSADDRFGYAVAGAGDVDGDGWLDVIVGAPFDDTIPGHYGVARVFSGQTGAVIWTLTGIGIPSSFGYAVDAAGDVDQDGRADLLIAAPFESSPAYQGGVVRVISGATGAALLSFHGDATLDQFGAAAANAGDVNNDGRDDFIVGAPAADGPMGVNTGLVRVFSGADGAVLHSWMGTLTDWNVGVSVDGVGDVNGDGYGDVVVGDLAGNSFGPEFGHARVYSGLDGSVLLSFHGTGGGDFFGYRVAGAGDANGDGTPDVLVGAFGDDDHGSASGSAWLFSGADGSVLFSTYGETSGSCFGNALASGDVNGDGFSDVLVGAATPYLNNTHAGTVRAYSGSCFGGLTLVGSGVAGSGGFVPELVAEGCPAGTFGLTLRVQNGLGGAYGLLLFSAAPAMTPAFGGTVYVGSPLQTVSIHLGPTFNQPGEGKVALPFVVPDLPALTGASIHLQALLGDPGASAGVSMTNGLHILFG